MKHMTLVMLLLAACLSACQPDDPEATTPFPPAVEDEDTSVASQDGVYLVLDLPKTQFVPGESFTATVLIENQSDHMLQIEASSSALCKLHLMRPYITQWDTFKTYPEAAAMVITPWTLRPGERRTFAMPLTVEKDWPTYELIRMQAQINGLDDLETHVDIEVLRPE